MNKLNESNPLNMSGGIPVTGQMLNGNSAVRRIDISVFGQKDTTDTVTEGPLSTVLHLTSRVTKEEQGTDNNNSKNKNQTSHKKGKKPICKKPQPYTKRR